MFGSWRREITDYVFSLRIIELVLGFEWLEDVRAILLQHKEAEIKGRIIFNTVLGESDGEVSQIPFETRKSEM